MEMICIIVASESWLFSENPLRITIQGTHRVFHNNDTQISKINLTYSVRDTIVLSRRVDHRTAKGIKAKLLTSFNGAPEEVINNALASQRVICDNDKLRQFVARDDKKLKDDTGPWTQLDSLVNDILKPQGFILYYQIADVNQPVDSPERYYQLTISDEFWLRNARDYGKICIGIDAGCGLPIAFAKFKYPIALAFKIVGRSRTEETAIEMVKQYNEFVSTLPIEKTKKDKLIDDLSKNWMSAEWKLSFIDAGRIPQNITNRLPWTTNNFTERINRTIEAVYSDLNKFESGLVTLFNTQTIEQ
ncbi:hypothetical protein GLOIN_2v1542684 [Rhizophagus clarus]|uniref:Uncharacterized protein n=1 Tax=Rhizophagus clarus TaxID=94130 RepID=A0A8H3R5C0_9GLOM|nr:hypothetical protein GLOIN_2v1542684 [Rhizophagus clarus]